jgi:putative ABC transport system permease protein
MDAFWQDVRFGARMLRARPLFTLAVVSMLAVGIGANTAVFSAATALLLRPLPIPGADRIVFGLAMREGVDPFGTSLLEVSAFQDRARSFASTGVTTTTLFNVVGDGDPSRVAAAQVSAGYLATLGVQPSIGRRFTQEDDRPGGAAIAIIGDDLWRRRFNADPRVVGRALTTDAGIWTIVGVMPAGFDLPEGSEIWVPMRVDPRAVPLEPRASQHNLTFVGALRPDVTHRQATAEVDGIVAQLVREFPQYERGWGYTLVPFRRYLLGDLTGTRERAIVILMAAVGFLLLICCVNVANLLLVRGVSREREMAVRLALGAGRARLVRHLVTECLLVGAIGGLAGVLVAAWLAPILQTLNPINVGGLRASLTDFRIDGRVLAFATLVSIATALVFAVAPALKATQATRADDVVGTLKRRDQRTGRDAGGRRWLAALVIGELAITTMLLVGAGLVVRSFARLQHVPLGFVPTRVLAMEIALAPSRYPAQRDRDAFVQRLLDRVRALPAVRTAGVTTDLPLDRLSVDAIFVAEGRAPATPAEVPITAHRLVSPGYLEALGVRLVNGRLLDARDRADAPPVVVVTEEFARQAWPDQDPIGRRARRRTVGSEAPWMTVVGVIEDVKEDQFNFRISRPVWYVPYAQGSWPGAVKLIVRGEGVEGPLGTAVREAIRSVDANQAVGAARTLDAQVAGVVMTERFSALVVGALSMIGLFLATCGLYAVVSYSVSQRTGEFGLRLALGAAPRDLRRLVLGHGAAITVAGIGLGLLGARALSLLLASVLYEVSAGGPATFAAVGAILATVALAACYVPAHRAASADPMLALRNE